MKQRKRTDRRTFLYGVGMVGLGMVGLRIGAGILAG